MTKDLFWGIGPPREERRVGRKKLPKDVRDQVWDRYIGPNKTVGKCYCCRWRPITYRDYEVGHSKAVAKGGRNNIRNLRPICKHCNRSMGTMSIEAYRKKYYTRGKRRKKPRTKKRTRRRRKESLGFEMLKIKVPRF